MTNFLVKDGPNFGLGTAAPNEKLTVEGAVSLTATVSVPSATGGYGKLYTQNVSSVVELHFLDSNGNTVQLTSGGAPSGGNVSNSGTPVDNQIAVWTTATAIEGSANLVFTGTALGVGTNAPTAPLTVLAEFTSTSAIETVANFRRTTSGTAADGLGLAIVLAGEFDTGAVTGIGRLAAFYEDANQATTVDGAMTFGVIAGGLGPETAASERLRLGSLESVFNEAGADVDFRVEGLSATNALFVRGSDGNVGIGTSSPAAPLHIHTDGAGSELEISADGGPANILFRSFASNPNQPSHLDMRFARGTQSVPTAVLLGDEIAEFQFRGYDGADTGDIAASVVVTAAENFSGTAHGTNIDFRTLGLGQSGTNPTERLRITADGNVNIPADSVNFSIGASDDLTLQHNGTNSIIANATGDLQINGVAGSEVVFNESGDDVDFRVEGLTATNLLFVDASTDRVGIGTSTPGSTLEVVGSSSFDGSVVVNESGADVDFRVEGLSATSLLFVDASTDRVGINTFAPSVEFEVDGAFVAQRAVVALTATTSLDAVTDNRKIQTNEGATALVVVNLPSAVAGLEYEFVVQDADGIEIHAATGDTIRQANTVSSAGGTASSTSIGDTLRLVAINATEWVTTASQGTWTLA